ncbi:abortive infection protein, AbiV family [Bradyrhizobium erythrophlei]|nr:abortive infection protein, AbiV family [Bradyrhizobium erythrophlei]
MINDDKTLEARASEHALIITNANRLLWDAKLLADHTRFASAFALAVLGLEEIGKVILDIWGSDQPLSKPVIRRTAHVRKQAAIGSLLLASFAVKKFGHLDAEPVNDDPIARISAAFRSSDEAQFLAHIQSGELQNTKHGSLYRDDWLIASLPADQFDESHVTSIFDIANSVLVAIGDERIMHAGRALYEASP